MRLDGRFRRETRLQAALLMVVLLVMIWWGGALAHLGLTVAMVRLGIRMWPAIYIQAAVAGTIAALLVGTGLVLVLYRREILRRQLLVVAELNHQVPNSLEIIASSTSHISDQHTVVTILEAVMRIDATLRSLFPIALPIKKKAAAAERRLNTKKSSNSGTASGF